MAGFKRRMALIECKGLPAAEGGSGAASESSAASVSATEASPAAPMAWSGAEGRVGGAGAWSAARLGKRSGVSLGSSGRNGMFEAADDAYLSGIGEYIIDCFRRFQFRSEAAAALTMPPVKEGG
eukprot:CAMPEP_0177696882 /NCGR_PEP_ID=MMETSP0484_2-20121128/4218_1 /TAXON_ID=354590 /ORGANISM="Rhodomonas lens, Strain RHODO" /LENGTH=123 /DNA_ID=CAMNT_0019207885 /DNA_START=248 /DNA_END=619 /DNA_ORIENTATION=+